MRLLIVTQKVDKEDPILGFFHRWIVEFASRMEGVVVICLEKGEYELPRNVEVVSLGKEERVSRLGYIFRFYSYIVRYRREYDSVLIHMNPEYAVLGAPIFWLLRKRVYLWYVHRQVNLKLRLAVLAVRKVFTSTKESLRVATKKAVYMGHGIDTQRFAMSEPEFSEPVRILHLGRITRIKHIECMIRALPHLNARLILAGSADTPKDIEYDRGLKALAHELGVEEKVEWRGPMKPEEALREVAISFNGAPDGGMDKAVLESIAAGRPVFVTNKAFKQVMGDYWDFLSYPLGDAGVLEKKIKAFLALPPGQKSVLIQRLEEKVRLEYDIQVLIGRITDTING